MNHELLLQVFQVIVQVVIIALGGYLINFLKSKVGAENLNKYYSIIKMVVMGVEQAFGPGNGVDKKVETLQIIKKLIKNKLCEEQINSLIESAVFEMNRLHKGNGIIS